MQKHVFISIRTRLGAWLLFILIATALGVVSVVSSANRHIELASAAQIMNHAATQYATAIASEPVVLPSTFTIEQLQNQPATQLQQLNAQLASSFVVLVDHEGTIISHSLAILSPEHNAKIRSSFLAFNDKQAGSLLLLDPQIYRLQWLKLNPEKYLAIAMALPLRFAESLPMFGVDSEILHRTRVLSSVDNEEIIPELKAELAQALAMPASDESQVMAEVNNKSEAPQVFMSDVDQNFHQIRPLLGSDEILLHLRLTPSASMQLAEETQKKILIVFALAGLATLLFVHQFSNALVQPIQALGRIARALGRGESVKMHGKFTLDEVGELRQAMYGMQQSLHQRTQQLRYQANHDALTGLLNRFAVGQQLETHLLTQSLCLVQINIKGFKEINQSLGFVSGDELLQQLAKRFAELEPEPVLSSRLDSVEFLLVYATPLSKSELSTLLNKLSKQYQLVHSSLQLSIAAGIALIEQHADMGQALRQVSLAAQQAMQEESGVFHYHPAMDDGHKRRLTIIRDLPVTNQSDDFYVTYLPKINLRTMKCEGAEALIRWQHPKLGVIPPDEFIRIAEYAGSIHFITQWMFTHVLADQSRWRKQGHDLQISINLSVYDLLAEHLGSELLAMLKTHELNPERLVLEVTEAVVMNAPSSAIARLHQIQQSGIRLALDKFGSGNSSLAFLKTLPVAEVKIDRVFVKNLQSDVQDQLIINTSTKLAHDFGFTVTAEGVEDSSTLALLQQAGCDAAQGYHFAKPLPAREFIQWLQEYNQSQS
jgi:diguanylate cyclase (GGDEF)-like protein